MVDDLQRAMCEKHGVDDAPPAAHSRVGIALQTLRLKPLNGLRVRPTQHICGWYIWAGEETSNDADFYQPMCIEHIQEACPAAVPFLALPPGWRFLVVGEYEDVWFDESLISNT